jgi:branched-chain amino acid aminotransferase
MALEQRDGVVFIDGERRSHEQAVVSVYDRGFLYGDSVFEVIRTYGGRPFGLEEHVARLHRSAAKLAMELPWTEADLVAELGRQVREAGFAESYVRVVVTRGSGPLGLDTDLAERPTRVTLIHALTLPPPPVYRDGVALLVVSTTRATDGTAAEGAKASNYLANLLALREAKARGAYEPLFVETTPAGVRLALEGGSSNVFALFGDVLVTPPERRILSGVTRRHAIEAAGAAGLRVEIADLPVDRLLAADEVFITSTIREIVPVVRVLDGERAVTIGAGVPGPAVRRLHRAFRARLGGSSGDGGASMPWE